MKKLLLSVGMLAGVFSANAQLPAGSFGENFTVTAYQPWLSADGMNSNGTYTLYDYLDAGYTVILDVSATWCGPCWNHHLTGALEDLYVNHGPAGHAGVSGTTTDDVMVFWIDGDGTTADATMLDGAGTIGNWTNPNGAGQVMFPMANPITATANQINDDYAIAYFPTIYRICPNRIVTEVGQLNAAAFYTSVGSCPAPASAPADAAALSYSATTEVCPGDYTPKVEIQNNGTANMTNATVTIQQGGNTVSTGTFTGNLTTYGVAEVVCSTISGFAGGTLNIVVTTAGDANAANGTLSKNITVVNNPAVAVSNMLKIDITTDRYGSETTWELTNAAGSVVASGGPWANLGANGQTVRATVNANGLTPNECYRFTIYDAYGDGICCDFGNGAYSVKDANDNVLLSGAAFESEASGIVKAGAVVGIADLSTINLNVFPNPASENLNIQFEAVAGDYVVTLTDLSGRVVVSNNYSNISGAQNISVNVADIAEGNYLVSISNSGAAHTKMVTIK